MGDVVQFNTEPLPLWKMPHEDRVAICAAHPETIVAPHNTNTTMVLRVFSPSGIQVSAFLATSDAMAFINMMRRTLGFVATKTRVMSIDKANTVDDLHAFVYAKDDAGNYLAD